MPKSLKGGKSRDRVLKEAVRALSVAAKSLALASDALSRLYDTDEDDTCTAETVSEISVESKVHHSPHTMKKPVIDYEDSDDEYMILARKAISVAAAGMGKAPGTQPPIEANKPIWSEMQNNFGAFEAPSKGGTESESGLVADDRLGSSAFRPLSRIYDATLPKWGPHIMSEEVMSGKPSKPDGDPVPPPPPKTWANLARLNADKWGVVSASGTHENFDGNSIAEKTNDDPKQGTSEPFANLKNRWVTPTELQRKVLRPLLAGSDILLLHANLKSHVHAILVHCVQTGNPNLTNHLTGIRFVIYAGAHELTKNDVFLSFQFNMIKRRMPTRAKSPRQIIIAAAYMDDHIQVVCNRALSALR
ncbi:hypothetical protein RSAG8_02563, partial [Rhizoctonia solani AG-8 WAC10335]